MFGDTVVAISTAWGDSGVSVIRMSGEDSLEVALRHVAPLCRARKAEAIRPRVVYNAWLLDEYGEAIDQVLFIYFKSPKSYTGEDVVEVQCHGGSLVAQRCLELLISAGARQAMPGEFTRRAFENGKIDLSQAEAVGAIIHARSNEALKAANRTLRGELSEELLGVYEELLSTSAEIEVGLDFPEEDVPYIPNEDVADRLETLIQALGDLLDRCSTGFILREGIRIGLLGRPNAGKSSLLNALLKEARAIVTSIPGTTRDTIEEILTFRGIPLRLVDTAGINEGVVDEVESIGIQKARDEMNRADVKVWVIDSTRPLEDGERQIIDGLIGDPHVLALNKVDSDGVVSEETLRELFPGGNVVEISAKFGVGIEELKEAVVATISGLGTLDAGLNASARQIDDLRQVIAVLRVGVESLEDNLEQGIVASCMAEAKGILERLVGKNLDDSLLDAIFSRFCVGK